MSNPILVPLLNPNEPEALLASLYITQGQQVGVDDLICTLETTKSTADVAAEFPGYVVALQVAEGQILHAGDLICYLAETPDWTPPEAESGFQGKKDPAQISDEELPAGMRITQPALKLAKENGLDLRQLPIGPMITGSMVQTLLGKASQGEVSLPQSDFDPTKILIYGCGGHGKACLDLLRILGNYQTIGFIDDNAALAGGNLMGLPVLGGSDKLADLHTQGVRLAVNAVGGIGNVAARTQVFQKLAAAGFACPAIVHPTAFVEVSASLSPGVQVFPHAYIGSESYVGFGSIVNTGATISHDCQLGNMVNISPGAILAGEVICEDRVLVGMGATINLQVKVGAGARIGNGATVKSEVPENGIVQAGGIWPN